MANSSDLTVLQIDGFIMRPIQFSDLDVLATIWADPEVTRFLPSQGIPISRENTEKSLQLFTEHWRQKGYGIWAIIDNISFQMSGYCGLRYLGELDEFEVLYGLAREYWNRGIATQAARASISFAFSIAALERIISMVLPDNQASRRVIEKAGLSYEKEIHIFNLDVLYYAISRRAI